MRTSLFIATLILIQASLASAADIIWVHQMRGGGDGENNTARGEGTLSWEDDAWRQLIEDRGHNIIDHDFYDDLETISFEAFDETIAEFEAADLVMFSRDSNSGDYNDPIEHEAWTSSFSTPMIVMTPYLLRSNRWDMVQSTSIQDAANPMVPTIPDHPIFEGVELNADGQIDFWSQLGDDDNIDLVNATDFGFAEVIATEADTDIPWIAYWDGETEDGDFYDGSSTFAAGPRLYLSAGSDDDPNSWGEKNITPAGDQIVLNAITFLTGDPGTPPVDTCTPGAGDFDGNGKVEFADFLILSTNFGSEADAAGGDVDCNGMVEFADFLVLSSNFGTDVAASQSVPEPSGLMPSLLGMLALAAVTRRRR